mmetsp:Transcript_4246/g.8776  ORF Transcript_4246/g.8776 Transcript_4246/m.8776 type:complete len:291 (+) Transcript_4246:115-987(+)
MDDDLDAFFDDVENAVKEAQETEPADENDARVGLKATTSSSSSSAIIGNDGEERPAKRSKVDAPAAVASRTPVKAVVASSVPVISILPSGPPPANNPHLSTNAIPPPPPPSSTTLLPSKQAPNAYEQQQKSSLQNNRNNNSVTGQIYGESINGNKNDNNNGNKKNHIRSAAGQTWTDPTLDQWPENDFRLFVGNLAKDLKQHHLEEAFSKYPSFAMARIMFNKTDGKSRGYGFVSVLDPKDCARAIREMDQSWLGSRPIKVKRSEWKDREWKEVQKKGKMEKRYKKRFIG